LFKFKEQKTNLFHSNGKIYGRFWPDLSRDYKDWKRNEIGRVYPMNILYGPMLEALITKALKIEESHFENTVVLNISVDTNRMDIPYADVRNSDREYISFSDEEKKELIDITLETIREHFRA
jgi:hypothetical protein